MKIEKEDIKGIVGYDAAFKIYWTNIFLFLVLIIAIIILLISAKRKFFKLGNCEIDY